ncbi:MAG: hypothetical protein WA047_07170 [Phenylobacterium sp.]|uniref:hypothetical protein n=1 Tax=Phenylobacterium sp. TaxID=1871053 RepID=UPI003BB7B8D4
MRTVFRPLAAALVALSLAGCATVTAAPAGRFQAGVGQEVTLGRMWSDITPIMFNRGKKVRVLSIDGPLLNALYVGSGLVPGDNIVQSYVKERPTPLVRAGMSASERLEFVSDSVAAMSYQRVSLSRPRSAKLGDAPGVRFDLDAATSEGLEIKGTGVVAEVSGKLYLILYLAPAEHYFQTSLPEVEAILASARVTG